jgi:TrpR-related protein YerC/YecD
MKDWKTPEMQELFGAMLLLKTPEEMGAFLRDLCTITELTEMGKRFAAVKMLQDGISIRDVAKETGLSTTTVSRVSQWKKSLGEGGYDLVLKRLKNAK